MADIDSRQQGILKPLQRSNDTDPINGLRRWISQVTGLPESAVRQRWVPRPGTRPALDADWAAVGIERVETHGAPDRQGKKGDLGVAESGDVKSVTHQTLHVVVSFYGPNAMLIADLFRDSAQFDQTRSHLERLSGLTLQAIDSDALRLPDLLHEQWVDRYDIKLRVGRRVSRTYGVRSICAADDIKILKD